MTVFPSQNDFYKVSDEIRPHIFIYQLNSATPKVIKGSDITEWPDGPVSFIYTPSGIETKELFYERNIAPNPLTGDLANINFFVRNHQKDFEINVYDAIGNLVKTIYRCLLRIHSLRDERL